MIGENIRSNNCSSMVNNITMANEISMAEGIIGQELPHDIEMIMAAFLLNLRRTVSSKLFLIV